MRKATINFMVTKNLGIRMRSGTYIHNFVDFKYHNGQVIINGELPSYINININIHNDSATIYVESEDDFYNNQLTLIPITNN